jgi:hypothetical protein
MNSKEFVLWLKGFTEGVHEFNITPKQWDTLKDKLAQVKDEEPIGFPFGVPNTAPIQTLPFIQPYNPHNPYIVNYGSGSCRTSITTTPGSTSTTMFPISGSNVSYTTYQPYTTQTDDDFEKKIINEIKNKGLYTEPTSKFKKRKAKSVKEWEDTHDLGGEE